MEPGVYTLVTRKSMNDDKKHLVKADIRPKIYFNKEFNNQYFGNRKD